MAERCVSRKPTAYILGEAYLGGYRFLSDERALIRDPHRSLDPRRIEPMVECRFGPGTIVEVCCGGGNLGIVAAQVFQQSRVWLADLDESALSLARDNVALHKLADRVGCYRETS